MGDLPRGRAAARNRFGVAGRLAFATRCRLFACALLAVLLVAGAPAARADVPPITVDAAVMALSPEGDAWQLSADFTLVLQPTLVDAVNRGVVLYFVADFSLYRPRWYWFNQLVTEQSQTYRLSYHALTQQYRVVVNGYTQRYATLDEAVRGITRLRGWRVVSTADISNDERYRVAVRLRLDTSQLPKPFQMSAMTDRDWDPPSEWKEFPFSPGTPTSAP